MGYEYFAQPEMPLKLGPFLHRVAHAVQELNDTLNAVDFDFLALDAATAMQTLDGIHFGVEVIQIKRFSQVMHYDCFLEVLVATL